LTLLIADKLEHMTAYFILFGKNCNLKFTVSSSHIGAKSAKSFQTAEVSRVAYKAVCQMIRQIIEELNRG
jgi:hypothetical protein